MQHKHNFFYRIEQFNAMYRMESIPQNQECMARRLFDFRAMLEDEVAEGQDITSELRFSMHDADLDKAKVMMADWLGDMIVYCASEAMRWDIDIEKVLEIIMDSNASKLQADGTASFIAGKLQKGPGYWKPEPKIAQLLKGE